MEDNGRVDVCLAVMKLLKGLDVFAEVTGGDDLLHNLPEDWQANLVPVEDPVIDRVEDNGNMAAFTGWRGGSATPVLETNQFQFQIEIARQGLAMLDGMRLEAKVRNAMSAFDWGSVCDGMDFDGTYWGYDDKGGSARGTFYAIRYYCTWTTERGSTRWTGAPDKED